MKMKTLIATLSILLVTGLTYGATLTITIETKNDAQTTVTGTRVINIANPATASRISTAMGGSLDALKTSIVNYLKNEVRSVESQAVRETKIQEMIEAEQAITEVAIP